MEPEKMETFPVSARLHYVWTLVHRGRPGNGQGCFLPLCDAVRAVTDLPVCAVGGLSDPDFIEEQLRAGRMDCAAMSRQLIADPAWPNKVMAGQTGGIHRCVRCNKDCLGGLMAHRGVRCIYERKR